MTPAFTKDSKPLGEKEKITRVPRDCDTRTHLKKVSPLRGWMTLGPLVLVEEIAKVVDYLSIIADELHSYMASVFSSTKGIFQQNSVSCQKARIVLERFKEYKDEFQLISWPQLGGF
ncbi:transposable element Tc1 transposase [Trichonephila clavipes]|nr:transposable element Tc1 transposase [Trichonephila clavipes]